MRDNDREKEWKKTAIKRHDNNYDADISNLNDDAEFQPIEEREEIIPLTEEEKIEVRKKLFFLLIIITIVLFFLLIVLIFDPFAKKDKKDNMNENTPKEEVIEEELSLKDLKDGPVTNNDEMTKLVSEIIYRDNEYYENDTVSPYNKDKTSIDSLKNANKLFLLSKTSDFNSLVSEQLINSDICNNEIIIPTSKIDDILSSRFNTTITKYESFIYNYYIDNTLGAVIKFSVKDNNYIGKCYSVNKKVVKLAENTFDSCTKEKDLLYIDVRVVFINKTGVYRDAKFSDLITADKSAIKDQYMLTANKYRYVFDISGNDYVLKEIYLLK